MFGRVQALNGFAVEHIIDGEYRQAVEALDCTMLELSTPIGRATSITPTTSSPQCSKSVTLTTGVSAELGYEYRNICTRNDNQRTMEDNNDFFFLPGGLEFEPELLCTDDEHMSEQQYCFCTITCLYNMGLCYHLEWSKTFSTNNQVNQSLLLKRALTCYERAFSLSYECHIPPQDTVLQILMAVCNNAVHCSKELLANLQMAKFWNDRLFQVLKYVRHARLHNLTGDDNDNEVYEDNSTHEDCDYHVFIIKSYFVRQELIRPTGAAAA
mmetsp:Transcript_18740/g.24138  ORF Transcript_18740/g.24138 Transcript_18740/m.24138 type:complete len:269 (+) Transcript_18740:118-924(+)